MTNAPSVFFIGAIVSTANPFMVTNGLIATLSFLQITKLGEENTTLGFCVNINFLNVSLELFASPEAK